MQGRKKRISTRLRNAILKESMVQGCNLAALARAHQVSVKTLYTWRKKYYSDSGDTSTTIQAPDQFVEIKVPEEIKTGSGMKLKKAVLEFDEFSISIEGKLNPQYLNQILEIMR